MLIAGGAAIVAAALVVTAILISGRGTPHTLTGTLQLADADGLATYEDGNSCSGSGGFRDIEGGAQVTVLNEDSSVVGIGGLSDGVMADGYCLFPFKVSNVAQSATYQIEIGSSGSRGMQRYSDADLSAAHYSVALSLGDSGPVPPRPACPTTSDISITASLQKVATYDFLPGKEDVTWRFTARNNAAVDVYISGTAKLVFPNGQQVENNSYFPNVLKAGASWDPSLSLPESFVEVPSSWGTPTSITPVISGLRPQGLCK